MRVTLGRSSLSSAARSVRVALALCALASCSPTATIGVYSDAGARCDPLASACGVERACSLRADPALDACRDVDGVPAGEPCATPDACEAGSQCVSAGDAGVSLDPSALATGVCARVCARDVPSCETGERCAPIVTHAGVRIDYGACVR